MPLVDIRLAITVGPGTQGASPDHTVAFLIPSGLTPQAGLALTAAQQTKLRDTIVAMVTQVENYGTPL